MGNRRIDMTTLRACARPTPAQQHEFIEHVCYAHSWYKHIPLDGADFVVFLGEGDKYGRSIPVESYRRLCGTLDYAWRFDPGGPWRSDSGEVELAQEIAEAGAIRLFPWCSNDLAAIEVMAKLHAGKLGEHARKVELAALFEAEKKQVSLWQDLPPELQEAASRYDADTPANVDERVLRQVSARHDRDVQYRTLRAGEIVKLERAVAAVLAL